MRQSPILFSSEMVEAILAGRKTQTRRIIEPQPDENGVTYMPTVPSLDWEQHYKAVWKPWIWDTAEGERITQFCRYGEVGDLLYVRETWRLAGWNFEDREVRIEYQDGETVTHEFPEDKIDWVVNQIEKLENKGVIKQMEDNEDQYEFISGAKHPWSPGIHLPKWASRIWLKITKLRVERLQNISDKEAIAEGIKSFRPIPGDGPPETLYKHYLKNKWGPSPIHSYETLWKKINGVESWEANPWVWVIEFKPAEKP